ncbi:hypothetical protein [Sporisorium scitamineum]|uniref:Uncharacterized protein n=1 Tax=Sporisorium scitamineum TaxID=49012 RepID=A0A0F7S649_9BASI|nr:hypothetical protein [Sporisorium scitamineum]
MLVNHAGKPWDTVATSTMLKSLCKQYISTTTNGLPLHTWWQLARTMLMICKQGTPPAPHSSIMVWMLAC